MNSRGRARRDFISLHLPARRSRIMLFEGGAAQLTLWDIENARQEGSHSRCLLDISPIPMVTITAAERAQLQQTELAAFSKTTFCSKHIRT